MEMKADCIHCGEPVDDDAVDHWKTCPAHPANKEISALKEQVSSLRAFRENFNEHCLEWRGIDPVEACPRCGGTGIVTYGSTATWRGGIGGQAMTSDVCDLCWGSGLKDRAWPSLRSVDALKRSYDRCNASVGELTAKLEMAQASDMMNAELVAKLKSALAALLDRIQIMSVKMDGNHTYTIRRGRKTAEAIQAARDILERG